MDNPAGSLVSLLASFTVPEMQRARKLTIALHAAKESDPQVAKLAKAFQVEKFTQFTRLVSASNPSLSDAEARRDKPGHQYNP